jgi:hypothetical protein
VGLTAPVFPARQMLPYCSVRASPIASFHVSSNADVFAPENERGAAPWRPAAHHAFLLILAVRAAPSSTGGLGQGAAPRETGNLLRAGTLGPGAGMARGLEALDVVDWSTVHTSQLNSTRHTAGLPPVGLGKIVRGVQRRRGAAHLTSPIRDTTPRRTGARPAHDVSARGRLSVRREVAPTAAPTASQKGTRRQLCTSEHCGQAERPEPYSVHACGCSSLSSAGAGWGADTPQANQLVCA